jgi:hypothetical protein
MKQITTMQAEALACAEAYVVKNEIEYCQADWIIANARYIADIECKRIDKTFYGTWPKGWKVAMKAESTAKAKADLTARFIARQCFKLDGVLWLGNLKLIEKLKSAK